MTSRLLVLCCVAAVFLIPAVHGCESRGKRNLRCVTGDGQRVRALSIGTGPGPDHPDETRELTPGHSRVYWGIWVVSIKQIESDRWLVTFKDKNGRVSSRELPTCSRTYFWDLQTMICQHLRAAGAAKGNHQCGKKRNPGK